MINRQDLMRVVRVEASVDTDLTTSLDVNRLLQKKIDISKDYQDYSVNFGGEQEDAQDSFTDLVISFAFAMGVISRSSLYTSIRRRPRASLWERSRSASPAFCSG